MENIIQRNTTQAYQSDMAIYAIETNRRRAFADYKDGMKLCQRRIIYAMAFDLACKSRLVKTAKVTGQVMELITHMVILLYLMQLNRYATGLKLIFHFCGQNLIWVLCRVIEQQPHDIPRLC